MEQNSDFIKIIDSTKKNEDIFSFLPIELHRCIYQSIGDRVLSPKALVDIVHLGMTSKRHYRMFCKESENHFLDFIDTIHNYLDLFTKKEVKKELSDIPSNLFMRTLSLPFLVSCFIDNKKDKYSIEKAEIKIKNQRRICGLYYCDTIKKLTLSRDDKVSRRNRLLKEVQKVHLPKYREIITLVNTEKDSLENEIEEIESKIKGLELIEKYQNKIDNNKASQKILAYCKKNNLFYPNYGFFIKIRINVIQSFIMTKLLQKYLYTQSYYKLHWDIIKSLGSINDLSRKAEDLIIRMRDDDYLSDKVDTFFTSCIAPLKDIIQNDRMYDDIMHDDSLKYYFKEMVAENCMNTYRELCILAMNMRRVDDKATVIDPYKVLHEHCRYLIFSLPWFVFNSDNMSFINGDFISYLDLYSNFDHVELIKKLLKEGKKNDNLLFLHIHNKCVFDIHRLYTLGLLGKKIVIKTDNFQILYKHNKRFLHALLTHEYGDTLSVEFIVPKDKFDNVKNRFFSETQNIPSFIYVLNKDIADGPSVMSFYLEKEDSNLTMGSLYIIMQLLFFVYCSSSLWGCEVHIDKVASFLYCTMLSASFLGKIGIMSHFPWYVLFALSRDSFLIHTILTRQLSYTSIVLFHSCLELIVVKKSLFWWPIIRKIYTSFSKKTKIEFMSTCKYSDPFDDVIEPEGSVIFD